MGKNSICVDKINGFECQCDPETTGKYCEQKLHYCEGKI